MSNNYTNNKPNIFQSQLNVLGKDTLNKHTHTQIDTNKQTFTITLTQVFNHYYHQYYVWIN